MAERDQHDKALKLLNAFEKAGKPVARIVVDGRRIEIELVRAETRDEFDRIDMRHGKA
jgi:hypothetical protein